MERPAFFENVAVVTGASSGIGEQMALQLAKQGAWLVLSSRNLEKLAKLAQTCVEKGAKAIAVRADVSLEEDCSRLIDEAIREYGKIDTLINNAGQTMIAEFEEIKDLSLFEMVMRVNFLGAVYCTYYALPHLKKSKGRIVAISSLTGLAGIPYRTAYAASKHAMVGFFDSLRLELQKHKVTVTTIFPGFVQTNIRVHGYSGNGKPLKIDPVETGAMNASDCSKMILQAAAKRKRQHVPTIKARIGRLLRVMFPSFIDRKIKNRIYKDRKESFLSVGEKTAAEN